MANLLQTGTNQLKQVNRQRDLALALQQSALSFDPIQHPLQGVAKLAQALVSNQINKRADKKESDLEQKRKAALIRALEGERVITDPTMGAQNPDGTVQPNVFNSVPSNPLGPQATAMLSSLPVDQAEEVMANVMQAKLTEQQKVNKAGKPNDPFPDMGVRRVTLPGQEPFDAQIVQDMRQDSPTFGLYGTLDANQKLNPIDTMFMSDAYKVQVDDPNKLKPDDDVRETIVEGITALDQFDRLESLIDIGGTDRQSFIGGMRSYAQNVGATIARFGESFGLPRMQNVAPENPNLYTTNNSRYGRLAGGEARFSAEEEARGREQYGEGWEQRKQLMFETWNNLANTDAETTQLGISLAYTLARIADPGGRLSEMDVMNQMIGLGLDTASKSARMGAINQAKRTFAVNIKAQIEMARLNGQDVRVPPQFEQQLDGIIAGQALQQNSPIQVIQSLPPEQVPAYINSLSQQQREELYKLLPQ